MLKKLVLILSISMIQACGSIDINLNNKLSGASCDIDVFYTQNEKKILFDSFFPGWITTTPTVDVYLKDKLCYKLSNYNIEKSRINIVITNFKSRKINGSIVPDIYSFIDGNIKLNSTAIGNFSSDLEITEMNEKRSYYYIIDTMIDMSSDDIIKKLLYAKIIKSKTSK